MLIVIEGCVGAGKTTVATGLAAHRTSNLLVEEFECNPFLTDFYENPVENAFETEFAFLLLHYHQLKGLGRSAPDSETICDFHLAKDLLYADLNLKDARARVVFGELYDLCQAEVPPVDLLVFLSVSTEVVVKRIAERNRAYEVVIDGAYYRSVNAAYEDYFEKYTGRKIRIDMNEWDFVIDPSLFHGLSLLVDRELDIDDKT